MKMNFLIAGLVMFLMLSCGKEEEQPREVKLNGTKQLSENTTISAAELDSVDYSIPAIHCEGCESTISESVKELEGIGEITFTPEKVAKIKYNKSVTGKEEIRKKIVDAGYEPKEIN
jgi:copper chaperone CopZ